MTHDVFICHSSKDRTIANAICATLEQHKIRCWIAPRDVLPGMEYAGAIVEAIASTKLTVLVFSGNSNASPHVRREIERTVSHGIPVLPFRIEDVVPSPALEYFISDAHWLDAMTPPLEQHLGHLVGTVRLLLDRQVSATAPVATAEVATAPVATAPVQTGSSPAGWLPATSRARPAWQWAALAAGGVAAVVLAGVIVVPGLLGQGAAVATSSPPGQTATVVATPTAAPTAGPTPTAAGPVTPTDNPADDFYDPFDFAIADAWTWWAENPALWSVEDPYNWLTITSPAKPPLANVLLFEPGAERFGVTTRIRFQPTSEYQFAGLVLTGDDPDADRLQFGWAYCEGQGCLGEGLYFDRIVAGEVVGTSHSTALEGSPTELYIALDVLGNDMGETPAVYAQFSYDGGDEWFEGGVFPFDDGYTRVGLIVLDATDPIKASFEYVYVARYME